MVGKPRYYSLASCALVLPDETGVLLCHVGI